MPGNINALISVVGMVFLISSIRIDNSPIALTATKETSIPKKAVINISLVITSDTIGDKI